MGKKEFVAAALDPEYKIFIVYVVLLNSIILLSSFLLDVHPFCRSQIASLIAKKAFTKVPIQYSDFTDVFSQDLISKLFKPIKINNYTIELVNGQQSPYGSIYSLELVELGALKTYIETNLANRFIKPLKLSVNILILFERKSDGFLQLCVNYKGPNNLIIKNGYLLLLFKESLDRLRRARRFIQLEFTNTYYQIKIYKGDE